MSMIGNAGDGPLSGLFSGDAVGSVDQGIFGGKMSMLGSVDNGIFGSNSPFSKMNSDDGEEPVEAAPAEPETDVNAENGNEDENSGSSELENL